MRRVSSSKEGGPSLEASSSERECQLGSIDQGPSALGQEVFPERRDEVPRTLHEPAANRLEVRHQRLYGLRLHLRIERDAGAQRGDRLDVGTSRIAGTAQAEDARWQLARSRHTTETVGEVEQKKIGGKIAPQVLDGGRALVLRQGLSAPARFLTT